MRVCHGGRCGNLFKRNKQNTYASIRTNKSTRKKGYCQRQPIRRSYNIQVQKPRQGRTQSSQKNRGRHPQDHPRIYRKLQGQTKGSGSNGPKCVCCQGPQRRRALCGRNTYDRLNSVLSRRVTAPTPIQQIPSQTYTQKHVLQGLSGYHWKYYQNENRRPQV